VWSRWTVRPRGGDGVVHIRDSDDPRPERYVGAPQPVRVSGAVQPLVVVSNDCGQLVVA
jgi:hypothetical protein